MRFRSLVFNFIALIVFSGGPIFSANAVDKMDRKERPAADAPQDAVACTGWHALCSASPDCRMTGDKADCDCLRVNEPHIVATSEIQDPVLKRLTLARCTKDHPCDIDQAPVCKAIREGQYKVDHVKYDWVSTFSYRGWCEFSSRSKPIPCTPGSAGYSGDYYWAICDGAPCTENPNPANPDKPLTCQCRVQTGPFMGFGSCSGVNGGIMSSSPQEIWDFQRNTFAVPVPGAEYVKSACAPLKSDPFPLR